MRVQLQRSFWLVPVGVVLTCAVLGASTLNHLIDAGLIGEATAHARPVARPRKSPPPPRTKDAEAIVERNMFCSSCEPAAPAAAQPAAPGQPVSVPLLLVATALSSSGDHAATLTHTTTGVTGSYSVGDVVAGVGTVKRIGAQSVDVLDQAGGAVARVTLGGTPLPPGPTAAVAPAAAAPGVAAIPGIRQVGDTRFELDRALVDKTLLDPSAAAEGVRVTPVTVDGKPGGFRLFRVMPTSMLAHMGLKNGDVLQAINGMELTTADKTIEAYGKLRAASNFQLSVRRAGAVVTLDYTIRS